MLRGAVVSGIETGTVGSMSPTAEGVSLASMRGEIGEAVGEVRVKVCGSVHGVNGSAANEGEDSQGTNNGECSVAANGGGDSQGTNNGECSVAANGGGDS